MLDDSNQKMKNHIKPNYLFIMTDEERHAPTYETDEIKQYRETFRGVNSIKKNSVVFDNHYTSATACSPGRACLFTGHNISVHKLRDINGTTKTSADVSWIDPDYVPTMGSYFKSQGYDTCYIGKWHISDQNIVDFNNNPVPLIDPITKEINKVLFHSYKHKNKLSGYGFDHWIGPDPYIADAKGAVRDPVTTALALEWVKTRENVEKPFFIVVSYVNPHDIVLYTFNALTNELGLNPECPTIPESPNASDDLSTKPSAQRMSSDLFPKYFGPVYRPDLYRKTYYSLLKTVDEQVYDVVTAFSKESFFNNTIVSYTSDHGELLGSHQQHQKYYNAYEECIHIPLIFSTPQMRNSESGTVHLDYLTSSVDVLPTLLGLCGIQGTKGINRVDAYNKVYKNFYREKHRLCGNNLAGLIDSSKDTEIISPNAFFQTQDDVYNGTGNYPIYISQEVATVAAGPLLAGIPYNAKVIILAIARFFFGQYNSPTESRCVEAIVTVLDGTKYKLIHYFDEIENWTVPFVNDDYVYRSGPLRGFSIAMVTPKPSEYEVYNLDTDPIEMNNLVYPSTDTDLFIRLNKVLDAERKRRVLYFHEPNSIIGSTPTDYRRSNIIAIIRNILLSPFSLVNAIFIYLIQWICYFIGLIIMYRTYGSG
jgi:arylsulfatase A-like enzyme